jgi:hypothetical protein
MVAVINPAGSGELTFDAYAALARGAGNATSPSGGAFGGRVAPNSAASSTATITVAESTETQTQTQTQTGTGTPTGGGGGGGTWTATNAPTGTGNAAAGLAVPVAGLLAVAMGAFFV